MPRHQSFTRRSPHRTAKGETTLRTPRTVAVKRKPARSSSPGATATQVASPRQPVSKQRDQSVRRPSDIVAKAASILEDELAAGIVAAKRVESRVINVRQIRERSSDDLMLRFRLDAHEVVDIVMDLLTVAVESAGALADRSFSVRTTADSARPVTLRRLLPEIPVVLSQEPVHPGGNARFSLSLQDGSGKAVGPLEFQCSDLVSTDGGRLSAETIKFSPVPVLLPASGAARLDVTVPVPPTTSSGLYTGLLQARNQQDIRAVVTVQVAEE
jgi:hypothetical protein